MTSKRTKKTTKTRRVRASVEQSSPKTEELSYRHFRRGDHVRVGGLRGRYRIANFGKDAGGLYIDLAGTSNDADSSRTVNPEKREIIDADARFTWRIREGVVDAEEREQYAELRSQRAKSSRRVNDMAEATLFENVATPRKIVEQSAKELAAEIEKHGVGRTIAQGGPQRARRASRTLGLGSSGLVTKSLDDETMLVLNPKHTNGSKPAAPKATTSKSKSKSAAKKSAPKKSAPKQTTARRASRSASPRPKAKKPAKRAARR